MGDNDSSKAPGISHIEKLSGVANYSTWKFCMRMVLVLENLWDAVTGDDTDPGHVQKALARICLSIHSSLLQNVRDAKTAKEAWDKLSQIYEDKGLYRRILLLRKLYRTNYSEFSNMSEYINGIMTLSQQLADIGKKIEDCELAEILLSGLPSEFDVLVSGLETANISNTLSSELVRTRLLQEDHRRNCNDISNIVSSTAYAANKKIKVCHYCKRTGHIKARCFKLKKDREAKKDEEQKTFLTTATAMSVRHHEWIVDSGCSMHMSNNSKNFMNLVQIKSKVCVANSDQVDSVGKGTVQILLDNNHKIVGNALLVPELTSNLLSVSKLCDQGYNVIFNDTGCHIYENCKIMGKSVGHATNSNGIYKLDFISCNKVSHVEHSSASLEVVQRDQSAMVAAVPATIWHKRLGHLSYGGMRVLRNKNIVKFQEQKLEECIGCLQGKQVAMSFPKCVAKRATSPLELVHTDVCGPMPVCSYGGARYLLTFTDDYSRMSWGFLLRHKNEVMKHFIYFKSLVEKQCGFPIKCLRSDGGGEYCGNIFTEYLKAEGIIHQITVPYCPQQNGVAERLNRTVMEKVRCMLMDSGLSNKFWGEAATTALYLKNRCPTSALAGSCPKQVWSRSGSNVELNHLRVFGCVAFSLIPESKRNKLDPRSDLYIFVGYCDTTKGYRLVKPTEPKRIIFSRNVVFLENKFWKDLSNDSHERKESLDKYFLYEFNNSNMNGINMNDSNMNGININNSNINEINDNSENNQNVSVTADGTVDEGHLTGPGSTDLSWSSAEQPLPSPEPEVPVVSFERPVRSTRGKMPDRYQGFDLSMMVQEVSEPYSYNEAMSSPCYKDWHNAMEKEHEALMSNKVWKLVPRPENTNIIKCKWVYRMKCDHVGNSRYKARLVARGFSQQYGVDYDDTFSPVVRHSTMRLLFAIATEYNLNIDHFDVDTAFLNSDLKESIYMEQPEGFSDGSNKVCLLLKSIYGLKQASRAWNLKVNQVLLENGFMQSKCEPCVYIKKDDKCLTIVALYVDDFYVFGNNAEATKTLYNLLESKFNVKNLGALQICLGMKVTRDRNKGMLKLDQSEYIKRLLCKFGMENCRPVSTPMIVNDKLNKPEPDRLLSDDVYKYRELLGSLMYLAVCTRPDISFACSQLSQYNHGFGKEHWLAAKRILRYLAGTLNHGLCFYRSSDLYVTAYADADWANDVLDRKSYTGYVIKLGKNNINWESRKQRCVALSSTEAEYLAITDVMKDLCFLKNFLFEILCKDIDVILYNDNQSAHKLLEAKEYCHKKTKHIDLRYHFIKDLIQKGFAKVKYLPSNNMIADVLTKPLGSTKHKEFVNRMNVN